MKRKLNFNRFLIVSLAVHLGVACGVGGWVMPYLDSFNLGEDKEEVILLEIGWRETNPMAPQKEVKEKSKESQVVKLIKKIPDKSRADGSQKSGRSGREKLTLLSGHSPYLEEVRRRIERAKFYPPRAKMARLEGEVTLEFQIDQSGRVKDVNLNRPSRHKVFNLAARKILDKASPFPKPRDIPVIDKAIETTLVFELKH